MNSRETGSPEELAEDDRLFQALMQLLPATLSCIQALEAVQRQMHPPRLPGLLAELTPWVESLRAARQDWEQLTWPAHLENFAGQLTLASLHALRAGENLLASAETPDGFQEVMRGFRSLCRAEEALYPLHQIFKPVSQHFLAEPVRNNEALLQSLGRPHPELPGGITHLEHERGRRGGFSIYIPENLAPEDKVPLLLALHGGSGHGRDFLWTWLREARSRRFVLACPSSLQDTWSLAGPDLDAAGLKALTADLQQKLPIDPQRILLTGMSDGASYSLMLGLQPDSPFTHLAAFSGVLHPDLTQGLALGHARGRPVYLVHGTLDWMFPIERARQARDDLLMAGAELIYREIAGLSHNYARDENAAVLDWLGLPCISQQPE